MTAVVVLNGNPPPIPRLRELEARYPVYAADGGANACLAAGVTPVWVVGDFDSVRAEDLPQEWICTRIADQDSTDFEKLLRTLPADATDLLILGAFGDRLDHLLTNLLIVSVMPPRYRICLEGAGQELFRVTPQHRFAADLPPGSTLSLLPLTPAHGISSTGLYWNLHNASMGADLQLGQSNRVTGPVTVEVKEGSLFVWTADAEPKVF